MNDDQQFDIDDDAIRAAFERRSRWVTVPDLRSAILATTVTTRQRRVWPFGLRRAFERPAGPRVLVVALISTATVGSLLGVSGSLTTRPTPTPSAPAVVDASPGPDVTATPRPQRPQRAGELAAATFIRPFTYLPPTDGVRVLDYRNASRYGFNAGPGDDYGRNADNELLPGARGVVVAQVDGAVTHPCPMSDQTSSRVPVRSDPAGFAEDLRAIAGIGLGPVHDTAIDGFPALVAAIDPATAGCPTGDLHPPGSGIGGGYVLLNMPSLLYVVTVDGRTLAIVLWAGTNAEMEAWLPLASGFVESIRFAPPGTAPIQPPPELDPTPLVPGPDRSVTTQFGQPFTYAKAPASGLTVSSDTPDVVGFVDKDMSGDVHDAYGRSPKGELRSDAHGVAAALLSGATAAGCPSVPADHFATRQVPENFVADLRRIAGVHVGPVIPTTLDGHPASMVTLAGDPSCDEADLTIGDPQTGQSFLLGFPSRLYVVDIGGGTVIISIWAATDAELARFLPTATDLVESIRFGPR